MTERMINVFTSLKLKVKFPKKHEIFFSFPLQFGILLLLSYLLFRLSF